MTPTVEAQDWSMLRDIWKKKASEPPRTMWKMDIEAPGSSNGTESLEQRVRMVGYQNYHAKELARKTCQNICHRFSMLIVRCW
jgi:hypothetical protein